MRTVRQVALHRWSPQNIKENNGAMFGLLCSCSHAFEGQATLSAKCISQSVTETILVHAVQLAVSHYENVTESLKNM